MKTIEMDHLASLVTRMANSHVRNYVVPGLTSSLVGGGKNGQVRLLTSDRPTREWVVPHSHRFDFTCLVLTGRVENILFEEFRDYNDRRVNAASEYSPGTLRRVADGLGKYNLERSGQSQLYEEFTKFYGPGDTYSMTADQIHSIRFSKDAKVLFFESPEVTDSSIILEPYSNGKVVPTFETQPWMFEKALPDEP
jgi:hypothetical protein